MSSVQFCGEDRPWQMDPDGVWYSVGPQQVSVKLSLIAYEILIKINSATFCYMNLHKSMVSYFSSINKIRNIKKHLGYCYILASMFHTFDHNPHLLIIKINQSCNIPNYS